MFHSKLYAAFGPNDSARVIVGSSNLTHGGLGINTETNVLITGRRSDDLILDVCSQFDRISQDRDFQVPNEELLAEYVKLTELLKKQSSADSAAVAKARKRLDASWERLQTVGECGSWLANVEARTRALESRGLPEFRVEDFCASFQKELEEIYPDNRYVRESIRKQLQILVSNGTLKRKGPGKYRITSDSGS